MARWIDPGWQNPYAGRTPQETARWLMSLELTHWAALVASTAPIIAAFWYGYYVFGSIYLAANVLYNVMPNLLIRESRRRLLRISHRRPATRTDTAPILERASSQ